MSYLQNLADIVRWYRNPNWWVVGVTFLAAIAASWVGFLQYGINKKQISLLKSSNTARLKLKYPNRHCVMQIAEGEGVLYTEETVTRGLEITNAGNSDATDIQLFLNGEECGVPELSILGPGESTRIIANEEQSKTIKDFIENNKDGGTLRLVYRNQYNDEQVTEIGIETKNKTNSELRNYTHIKFADS